MTRLLRLPEVTEITGLSKATIYRRLAAGEFPAPVKVGPKSIRFRADDVEAWIAGLPVHVDLRKEGRPGEAR